MKLNAGTIATDKKIITDYAQIIGLHGLRNYPSGKPFNPDDPRNQCNPRNLRSAVCNNLYYSKDKHQS